MSISYREGGSNEIPKLECIILKHAPKRLSFAGKVFDRMSKGIREAPGKALIGDLAAESGDRTEGAFGNELPDIRTAGVLLSMSQSHQI